ncbi:hypothetical protein M408DRAFT_6697 [Serendipita vermifera MAFF 305830]|uniref:Uncharacterized protein n=1 Tax=Serendipita vermifera MAFF 305830 TaxID=933852 RepID=A0A0C2XUI6_SERVB|nr:hypothetical protein M408DRAFT_6697 [Serendipita vermifera MAFF 305830]
MLAFNVANAFAALCLLGSAFAHPANENLEERHNSPTVTANGTFPIATGCYTYGNITTVYASSVSTHYASPTYYTSYATVTTTIGSPVTVTSYLAHPTSSSGPPASVTTVTSYIHQPSVTTVTSYIAQPTIFSSSSGAPNATIIFSSSSRAPNATTFISSSSRYINSSSSYPGCPCVCGPTGTGNYTIPVATGNFSIPAPTTF